MFHILPNDKVIAPLRLAPPLRLFASPCCYQKCIQKIHNNGPDGATYLAVVAALSGLVFVVFIVDGAE